MNHICPTCHGPLCRADGVLICSDHGPAVVPGDQDRDLLGSVAHASGLGAPTLEQVMRQAAADEVRWLYGALYHSEEAA